MRLTGDLIRRAAALAAVLVVAVVVAVLLLRRRRRRLHGQGALPERRPARQGQPRPGRGAPVGKVEDIDLTDDGQAEVTLKHRRGLRAAAPGTQATSARPRCRASPTATSTCAWRRRAPRRSPTAASSSRTDDHRGRPRPALQHVRPRDAQGAAGRDPRLGQPDRGPGRGVQRGHGLPQPVARRLEPAVPRAQPRHAAARALHRLLLAARHRHRRPPRRPRRPRRQPRHHDHRDRQPEGGARRAIGQLPDFMRRANTTFVNLRARSTTSTRWSRTPSRSPRSCARSSPSCARCAATRARRSRPLGARGQPGRDNDLIELTKLQVPLRDVTVRKVAGQRQGARGRVQASPRRR